MHLGTLLMRITSLHIASRRIASRRIPRCQEKNLTAYPASDNICLRCVIMERLIERGLLFDHYGGLLSEKNKRIYEACAVDDMSLAEIAEEVGISRQAVSETLRRIDEKLKGYEKELGLISKSRRLEECVEEIRSVIEDKTPDREALKSIADRIEEVI